MERKHNLRVRPLSAVLMGARLANSADREKANELIMIYSLPATPNNIMAYFDFVEELDSSIFEHNDYPIESSISFIDRFCQWKEEYKSLIYFKNGNDE